MPVPCIAHLPPALLDFALTRRHADGVLLAGCRDGDCAFRLGLDWTEQRLAGERDPYLRKRVPRERICTVWSGMDGRQQLTRDLRAFAEHIKALGPFRSAGSKAQAAVAESLSTRN